MTQTSRRINRSRLRGGSGGEVFARSTVIKVERSDSDISRQLEVVDEWSSSAFAGTMLPVPYNVAKLFSYIEQSSILQPCIEAYVTNTVKTGWEIAPVVRGGKINKGEAMELESFRDNANSQESLVAVMAKVIQDRESVGFGFLEGIRDASGSISVLRHAPSLYTRLGQKHETPVLVEYTIQRGRRVSTVKEFRKFRRYAQLVGGLTVWFKEWGDPRRMNRDTGKFEDEPGYTPGADATEILHFKLPSNEPYGIPRWIIQLPSIIGAREAEEVNMRYFQDNTVPPMMLTVSGGRLTQHSFQELTRALSENSIGKDRQNRVMLIEATGDSDSLDKNGTPVKLSVEKLGDARQSDALFKDYDSQAQAKVRQSWRLPGVAVGGGTEQNNANAQIAMFAAESQVYAPARCDVDEIMNKNIVNSASGLGLKTVCLVSRTPSISSPETLVKTLTALNVMGAVTPRSAQATANKVLQLELPAYPEKGQEGYEEWMDMPLTLTTGKAKTHEQQASKTEGIKDIEETGDTGIRRPENGSENEEADE